MRGGTGRILIVTAYAIVAGVLLSAAPAGATTPTAALATVQGCEQKPPVARTNTEMPYVQQRFGIRRLAPLATGAGVTVAVVDSGVDDDHPQLRGQVEPGQDYLHHRSDARQDCKGHGTGVAGIIAARPAAGVAFQGLAPGARILPVRVSERLAGDDTGDPGDANRFAQAITWAAARGPGKGNADVINLSLTLKVDDARVRAAVEGAVRAGVVVVAAVGNSGAENDANPTPYPAAYPGVLGVGAVGRDGTRKSYSQHGAYVDVMAPGEAITVPAAGGGHTVVDGGTSYATPFVSATAALIMDRFPDLRGQRVVDRIIATADPAPGGARSDEYGFGVLNPYRALTETVAAGSTARTAAAPLPTKDPASAARQYRRKAARSMALRVAGVVVVAIVLVGLVALVMPNGRRRRWSPADRV
jgi:membrane-anchored mycosin MYCP